MSLKDTTKLLSKLRVLMKDTSILSGAQLSAYIIPSSDAHGSEYLSEKDQRRKFISGFSGSAGTAVVTEQAALLWTDGRYYLQASQELDSNWTLMKDGLAETPSIGDWLCSNLPESSNVGIDATLYEENLFAALANKLKSKQIDLKHVKQNLIDTIWQEHGKPVEHFENLIRLEPKHAGKRTSDKLAEIRIEMNKLNVDNLVVTSLDEIAWLLNMRGRDIPFGTVFFAYLIISQNDCKLFTQLNRLDDQLRAYLSGESNFEFYGYDEFHSFFEQFVQKEYVHAASNKRKIFLSANSNHAIHSALAPEFVHKDLSILARMKIVKNDAEIESAKSVHIRDSVTLVQFFHLLDKQFAKNQSVFKEHELNEFEFGKLVDGMRAQNEGFFSPSFETISSFGPNGSIIHYKPKPSGSRQIDGNDIFLLDSGGHYSDMGTTDVTRTVFLGDKSKITSYQKECFTRVLKGHIQLSMRVFPSGTRTDLLDSFARQALWQAGLDYRHGTGHGVGAMLNVHEIPIIANRKGPEIGLQANMIVTIEPGFYEDNKFGIRIENCVRTVKANTKYRYASNVEFLTFEPLTYVPIQRELIDKSLLTDEEVKWVNEYHQTCATLIGQELKRINKTEVYEWLLEETKPI